MSRIGVLALQGGFAAHQKVLRRLGHEALAVRAARDLEGLEGLVLPGGESTAQLKLIGLGQLEGPLRAAVACGYPVLATCAGLILAARDVSPEQQSFGWLDVSVQRNAYGRQLDSFEARSDAGLPLVFIRAPRICAIGAAVEVCERLAGEPILVREDAVYGATFHPELSESTAVHELVFGIAQSRQEKPS